MTTDAPIPTAPGPTIEELHSCVLDIVLLLQSMSGQLSDPNRKTVTVQDLVDLGVIDQNAANRLAKR